MTVVMLHFRIDNQPDFLAELEKEAKEAGLNPTRPIRMRGIPFQEIIVGFGSAGAFTALFQVISNLLLKNKDHEVTITDASRGITLTMKGHSFPKEQEVLDRFFPAVAETDASVLPVQKGNTGSET